MFLVLQGEVIGQTVQKLNHEGELLPLCTYTVAFKSWNQMFNPI